MNSLLQRLMIGGSTAAMFAAGASISAQAQDTAGQGVEQVVVSASRISIAGYTAPTPVTVISADALESAAKIDIGDSIRELPSVGASDAPNNGAGSGSASQGNAGISDVNLRNLGVIRTLVLFDGQRVVSSNPLGGGVDLSTLPTALIQRVDVVTGGASATWGSDAVSGVVNLVLNKNFTGIKGSVEYGDNDIDTQQKYKGSLTYGTDFDGDRGHIIISGNYTMSPNADFIGQQPYFNPVVLIPNPNGSTPGLVHQGNVGSAVETPGGLITASAKGTVAPANALAGIQFVGSAAMPTPFSFGTLPITNSNCYNCSGNAQSDLEQYPLISVPYHNTTLFGYASYKVTDDIKASIQLNYGQNFEENVASDLKSSVTVKSDNAYIPASIQASMIAGGITSFTLVTDNLNNNLNPGGPYSILNLAGSLGDPINNNTRQLMRGVFTLDGALGEDWSWNAYIQHSQIREGQTNPNDVLKSLYTNAVDAVVVTAAGADAAVAGSGLAVGSIQCRSTLTNPTNGCQPLDVFGTNNASAGALNYVQPGRSGNRAVMDSAYFLLEQEVASGSMQGTLPWELPAGKVAVAFGAEYRMEQQRNIADPQNFGANALWDAGNYTSFAGEYNVEEGFLEVDAPILKNNFVDSLDVQAAGRITSYSSSGIVETWKLGVQSQVNEDFKLRSVWSEDIRAPIISELYTPPSYASGKITSPYSGISVNALQANLGNPNLVPEEANTISAGVVFTPSWIANLSFSVDFYNILIKQAIFTPSSTQVVSQCTPTLKVALYCGDIFFGTTNGVAGAIATVETDGNGVTGRFINVAADTNGALNGFYVIPQNAASQRTSGLDFQGDYRMSLFAGDLDWHLLGNYVDENTRTAVGKTLDGAGAAGLDDNFTAGPKLHMTLTATYTQGPWSGTMQGRFVGEEVLNNAWTSGVQVDKNSVPAIGYLDLRGSYKWDDHIQLYAALDNAFNTSPPNIAYSAANVTTLTGQGYNCQYYDCIGRSYRLGVRFSF